VTRKYPLEALEALRERRVDEQAVRTAEQLRAEQAAERVELAARERHASAEHAVDQAVESERQRLQAGGVRAGELGRAADWQAREHARLAELAQAEQRARVELGAERSRSESARQKLAQADADARAVEQHRDAWQARERERVELAEEEAIVEQWSAKRHPPRGG
jgi:hypothetical protein